MPPRTNRAALPAPRPLSPRAAAYVRSALAAEAERSQAFQKAVAAALTIVTKAEKTEQAAVFDAKGNLVGVVDPAKIVRVINNTPDSKPANAAAKPADAATQPVQSSAADDATLGGPTPPPRSGVPVQVVDEKDEALAKVARLRKAALHADSPVERIQAYRALCDATLTAITATHRRG